MRLTEIQDAKITQKSPSAYNCTTLSGYIFAIKARSNNRKTVLNINISSTCPHNMVNFGPSAEIGLVSLGHPSWFQRVSRLGFVIFAIWSSFNRGRHIHSAGRPSRLAHNDSS